MGRLAERVVEVNLMTSIIHSAADEGAGGARGGVEAGAQDDECMLTDALTLAASAFVYFAPPPEDGADGTRVRGADGGDAEMGGVGIGQGGRTDALSLKRRLASILERIDDSMVNGAYDEWGAHHGAAVLADAAALDAVATHEPADATDEPVDETDEPADETDGPADETDEPADETDEPVDNATDAHLSSAHRGRPVTLAALLSTRDEMGWSALHHLAALGAARALAALLVRPGCPWDARDAHGHCPLQRALEYGQSTVAQLLCRSRARLSAPWVQLWRTLDTTLVTTLDTVAGPSVTGDAAMHAAAASPSLAPGARALPPELQALSSAAEASTHAFRVLSQQAHTLSSALSSAQAHALSSALSSVLSSAPGSDGGHSSGGPGGFGDAGAGAVASAHLSAKSEHLYQRLQMAAGRCKGPAHSKHGVAGPQDVVDGAKEPKQASHLCPSGVPTSKAISADGGSQQMDNESLLRRLQRAFTPHVV